MTSTATRRTACALIAGAALSLVAGPVLARPRYGRVTAHSRYGHGSVTGAVRRANGHYQVQLPSGFWEDCEGDCRETLRRQSLDFWNTIDEDAPNGNRR